MSRGRVKTLRAIYRRWALGDSPAGTELYDAHVLLVPRSEFPEPGAYRGPAEIARYMREFLADFDGVAIVGEEFIAAGDGVVVRVRQHATGPRSGAAVDMRYYHVWTFRGSSVIRIESIREQEDALEAVGLAG
jgi:ketosteroid isomerase-like protein